MSFTPPDIFSTVAFLILISLIVISIPTSIYLANLRLGHPPQTRTLVAMVGLTLWLLAFSAVIASGITQDQPVPFIPLTFLTALAVSVAFAVSPAGRWLVRGLPIQLLVVFQSFRFPLELILHSWAGQGVIPQTMTWDGQNFDIVSGLMALLIFPFAGKYPRSAWLFNIVGLGLLANVIRVAIWSSPLPFAWKVEPPMQLASNLPYALIIPVCIGGALAGHILLTRSLLGGCLRKMALK